MAWYDVGAFPIIAVDSSIARCEHDVVCQGHCHMCRGSSVLTGPVCASRVVTLDLCGVLSAC